MSSVSSIGFGVYRKDNVSFTVAAVPDILTLRNATHRDSKAE
jgi:hypothetical protein